MYNYIVLLKLKCFCCCFEHIKTTMSDKKTTTIPDVYRVVITVPEECFDLMCDHIGKIYGSYICYPAFKIVVRGYWNGNYSNNPANSIEFRHRLIPKDLSPENRDKVTITCFWLNFRRKQYGRWYHGSGMYEQLGIYIPLTDYTQDGESVKPAGKLLEFIEAHDLL